MKLTIVLATRGRPEILEQTVDTFLMNMTMDETTLLICVDEDDDATKDAIPKWGIDDTRLMISIEPREDTRGLKYNRALRVAPADVYLVAVDHTAIHTAGFDQMICNKAAMFPDGIGVICTPMANASFPFLQAPTAKLVELMGYIQPPQFPFWFIDHWLDDIARMIGRYVMIDVEVESNRRPGRTTGLRDLIFWASYYDALKDERRAQALRIIKEMQEPHWRKAALEESFPMVEYRSLWVNDIVRSEAAVMQQSRGDEEPRTMGYLRALNAAVEDWQKLLPADEAQAA